MPLDQKKADKNLQVPQETINANIGELVLQEPYIIDNFVSELVLQQPSNNSLISLNLPQMQEVVNNAIINFVPYKSQINNSALISLDLQQSENLCAIADIILPEHRGDTFVIDLDIPLNYFNQNDLNTNLPASEVLGDSNSDHNVELS